MSAFPRQGAPVCCRCGDQIGEQFITVHRDDGHGPAQAVAVHHDCASAEERRGQAERKAKGMGW